MTRHLALAPYYLRMIFSENRCTLSRIMRCPRPQGRAAPPVSPSQAKETVADQAMLGVGNAFKGGV